MAADAARIASVDHLVVAARSLDEGAAWCEATLGVVPQAGGRHVLMGTHNLLLAIGSGRFPRSYMEIIAIDAAAAAPQRRRWFDLDSPAIQAAIADAPCLVHWVAASTDMDASLVALRAAGHDPGTPTAAERATPHGLLRWRITLRDDGARPADGAVPLLIEWSGPHPSDRLVDAGVRLERIVVGGVEAALAARLGAEAAVDASAGAAPPPLAALLRTPRGPIELASPKRH